MNVIERHKRLKRIPIPKSRFDVITNIMQDVFDETDFTVSDLIHVGEIYVDGEERLRIFKTPQHTFIGKYVDKGILKDGWIGEVDDLHVFTWLKHS